jgi:hypothetical protein
MERRLKANFELLMGFVSKSKLLADGSLDQRQNASRAAVPRISENPNNVNHSMSGSTPLQFSQQISSRMLSEMMQW